MKRSSSWEREAMVSSGRVIFFFWTSDERVETSLLKTKWKEREREGRREEREVIERDGDTEKDIDSNGMD